MAAERWLDDALRGAPVPPLLLVLGLGDGALLDVLDARAPLTRVLALEPDPAQAAAFRRRDWTTRERDGRLLYLVDPDYVGADDAWRMFPPTTGAPTVLTHPAVAANPGPGAVRAARVLKRIVFGAQANATARQQFAPRYLTNSLRNLPAMLAGRDVRALADAFAGRPAVVAAAGPSLDAVVSDLCTVHEHAVLIAVDTALRPLLHAGARPHLAVGLDPSELNARHFHALPPCPETWLVSESALDGAAHRHFGDRTFWFRVAQHEPWPWYQALGLDVGQIEVWGSVVTAAFQIAVLAGCDPIVFVGTDLGYTDGRPYARATTYEFEWARRVAEGADLEALWQAWTRVHAPVEATDLAGRPTTTSAPLLAFRDWLVSHAGRSGRRVVNATGAGMFFGQGVEQMTLIDVLRDAPAGPPPVVPDGPLIETRTLGRPRVKAAVGDLRQALASGARESTIERFVAFSGGGWDAAATAAALDDALGQFEEAEHVEGEAPALRQMSQVLPGPSSMATLGQLPEAVARWHAVLLGRDSASAHLQHSFADADAGLEQAARHLLRLSSSATSRGHGLVEASALDGAAPRPLSLDYAWPPHLAWCVWLIEGQLGLAARWSLPAISYVTRQVVARESAGARAIPTQEGIDDSSATLACARLALHWAACAATLQGHEAEGEFGRAAMLRALASTLTTVDDEIEESLAGQVELAVHGPEGAAAQRWAVRVDLRTMARLETGRLWAGRMPAVWRPSLEVLSQPVSVHAASSAAVTVQIPGTGEDAHAEAVCVRPRVLTDSGCPKAHIAYVDDRGVICVAPHMDSSVTVRADGTHKLADTWPRPIVNQLPLGALGVAAWSSGHVEQGRVQPSYVMFRHAADGIVTVQELPFRPSWGVWWRKRLYWTCFPSGIGSWAPGEDVAYGLAEFSVLAIEATTEALLLSPGPRSADGRLLRRRAREVWRWDGQAAPQSHHAGPAGAASAHALGPDGWRATAYPEADMVRLVLADTHSYSMLVAYPFKLAWLGTSLLVTTLSGEVLLFEGLADRLAAAPAVGRRA